MTDQDLYQHGGMRLRYQPVGESYGLAQLSPADNTNGFTGEAAAPNFQLVVAGDTQGRCAGLITGGSLLPGEAKLVRKERTGNDLVLEYRVAKHQLLVTVRLTFIDGCRVIRQVNTVKNVGERAVTLTHFSSASCLGIATDGRLPWHHPDKIRVHYCRNTWNGEGQWHTATLEELGLYPNSTHPCNASIHFASIGGWSTVRFFPGALIEDIETGQIWYFQIESSSSWHYEIGLIKAGDGTPGTLYFEADCADEFNLGWHRELQPGEVYETMPVAFGCVSGCFDEAIRELTLYRRKVLKPANAWDGEAPLIFNDYMNCLWGQPTAEALLPLIDAAADAGAEGFCLDAGWFSPKGESWGRNLGDWLPADDRFGDAGLQGILDRIKSREMIPGLWLEIEACEEKSALFAKPDDWFLRRHGCRMGGGRVLLDFRNPEVRAYMHGVFDRLVSWGVGFIKNDYNQSTGPGPDVAAGVSPAGLLAPAEGLVEHVRAFYRFIDEVRARHTKLILENCGSGGMREDPGILAHFHLQSTSDQEGYTRNPSIINGSLANVIPEQAGIWVYPNPHLFPENQARQEVFRSPERRAALADGEETIFNVVNGLCGNFYLSGRIECLDEANRLLLKEGVAVYKAERAFIRESFPVWPLGRCRLNDAGFAAQGLIAPDGQRLLLAVWRLASTEDTVKIDLSRWCAAGATVKLRYPSAPRGMEFVYGGGVLRVRLPKPNSARYFEITVPPGRAT
jgi:alpha-galactosidase